MEFTSLARHVSGKKHSKIQISESLKIGATFFSRSNTGKGQTNDKGLASKERQKSQNSGKHFSTCEHLTSRRFMDLESSIKSFLPEIVFGLNELCTDSVVYNICTSCVQHMYR